MSKALRYGVRLARIRAKQLTTIALALARKQITYYPGFVPRFEQRFADYVGVGHGLSFCNGTSGLEAALFALGIGPGDEVIVPSCTFHASIDAIANSGATPVFGDVDPDSLTLAPREVERLLTPATRAVMVVHLYGNPADVGAIRQVIGERDVKIVEDASHAHGARLGDRSCGALGDVAVFSLQGSKAVAAGEGGVAVTDDEQLILRMSLFGHYDRHSERFSEIGAEAFAATGLGYKRRIAPVSVLMADADLDQLDWTNEAMNETAGELDAALAPLEGFRPTRCVPGGRKGGFFGGYPILVDRPGTDAVQAADALRGQGFEVNPYPFALHHQLDSYLDPSLRDHLTGWKRDGTPAARPVDSLPVTESLPSGFMMLPRRYLITMQSSGIRRLTKVLAAL